MMKRIHIRTLHRDMVMFIDTSLVMFFFIFSVSVTIILRGVAIETIFGHSAC